VLVPEPVVAIFPGDLLIVQIPPGNPERTTLPVDISQVG
jgi:hypothetical protein